MLQRVSENEKQRLMVMLEEMQMKEQVTMSLGRERSHNPFYDYRGSNSRAS